MRRILRFIRAEKALLAVLAMLALYTGLASDPAINPSGGALALPMFAALLIVMIWGASGVQKHADGVAELIGEPLGTLVLTLSVVGIEVGLISSVMLSGESNPTLARDTMFAVLMIVLNGLVGLSLLLGAARHVEQQYNFQGARAFLSVILPLAVFALILPAHTVSTDAPTFSTFQAVFFSAVTLVLYVIFLVIQTTRHRSYFVEPDEPAPQGPHHARYSALTHAILLLATLLPIILLSKGLAKYVDYGISGFGLPVALGGVLIAAIVLAPEGMSAVKAARANLLQRAVNLCLGAALSTIGMTVPAVLAIGLILNKDIVLGLGPVNQILLALTLLCTTWTFGSARTNVLQGAVHLVLFFAYLALIFSP
ncbi:calcium:proton antiporter [Paracoccaceae bacterium GXU_MW_L88]